MKRDERLLIIRREGPFSVILEEGIGEVDKCSRGGERVLSSSAAMLIIGEKGRD